MTISIGAVILSDDLIWENEFEDASIGQGINITILGNVVITTNPLTGGRTVELTARETGGAIYGYFTRSQIQTIKSYEADGTVVLFTYGVQSFNVVIKAGGVSVKPLLPKEGQGYDDYYTGTIILLES